MSNRAVSPSILILLALVVSLASASLATAGDSPWYVVAKLGQASADQDFGPTILGWKVDDEDTTTGVEVGYQFRPNFALELGYRDLGSYPGNPKPCPPGQLCPLTIGALLVPVFPARADFSGFSLAAVPSWPVTDQVHLFGKVGALWWDADLERLFGGQSLEDPNPSGTDVLLGVGGEYRFDSGLGLRAEYEYSDLVRALNVGASWRF